MNMTLCQNCGACINSESSAANIVPSCTVVDGTPCDPCLKIAELESNIISHKDSIKKLEKELSLIQTDANAVHDPFHRLPVELVIQIFHYCGTDTLQYPLPPLEVKPLLFATVCRAWGPIVYNSPSFWTKLDVTVHHLLNHDREDDIIIPNFAVVRQWVSRARARPLDVTIQFKPHSDFRLRLDELQELYDILREHEHQWQVIRLLAFPRDLLGVWFDNENPAINTILNNLDISVDESTDSSASNSRTISILHHSPSDVCLHHAYPSRVELDWKKLTSFTGTFFIFDLKEMLNLLNAAPMLQHFHVTHTRSNHRLHSRAATPFQHLKLQTLFIQYTPGPEHNGCNYEDISVHSEPVQNFLRSIRLPALVSFGLRGRYNIAASSLQALFSESHPPIEELVLSGLRSGWRFNGEALLDLLISIPQLKSLLIKQITYREEPFLTREFFEHFAGLTITQPPLLPSLESFICTGRQTAPWEIFQDIAKRMQAGRLNRFEMAVLRVTSTQEGVEEEEDFPNDYIDLDVTQRLSHGGPRFYDHRF